MALFYYRPYTGPQFRMALAIAAWGVASWFLTKPYDNNLSTPLWVLTWIAGMFVLRVLRALALTLWVWIPSRFTAKKSPSDSSLIRSQPQHLRPPRRF